MMTTPTPATKCLSPKKNDDGTPVETVVDRNDIPSTYRGNGWRYYYEYGDEYEKLALMRENADGVVEKIGDYIYEYFIFEDDLYVTPKKGEDDTGSNRRNYRDIYRYTNDGLELVWENPGTVNLIGGIDSSIVHNAGGRYIGIPCTDTSLGHDGGTIEYDYGIRNITLNDFLIQDTETNESRIVQYESRF